MRFRFRLARPDLALLNLGMAPAIRGSNGIVAGAERGKSMDRSFNLARPNFSPGTLDRLGSYLREHGLAVVGLFGAILLVFWPYLLVWPTPLIFPNSDLGTDLPREVWPLARFVTDHLRETGSLPLWRPYLLSGAPLIGHPVAPVLYPAYWLILAFPLALGLNLFVVLHLWWSAIGVYLWLHSTVDIRKESAFLGALMFSLAPRWIAHIGGGHWSMVAAIAWWPWSWFAFTNYWKTNRARWAVLMGLSLSAQALVDGKILAINLLWLAFWTIAHAGKRKTEWLRKSMIQWGLVTLIVLGLAAGQLIPFFDLLKYTTRSSMSLDEVTFGSLHPLTLIGLFFPSTFEFPEWFIYPGIIVLLFFQLSLRSKEIWRTERKWVIAATLGLVLSFGGYTPIYGWLFKWVPGFNLFRVPARWWLIPLFTMTYFASLGFDKWQNRTHQRTWDFLRPYVVIWLLFLSITVINELYFKNFPFEVLPTFVILTLFVGLLGLNRSRWITYAIIALFIIDVLWTSYGLITPEHEKILTASDKVALYLEESALRGERSFAPYAPLNASLLVNYDLRAADGYDPFQMGAYAEIVRRASGCGFNGYAVTVPAMQSNPQAAEDCLKLEPNFNLLKLLNIRYLILPASNSHPGMKLAMVDSGRWVYDMGPGSGRAFGVSLWSKVSASQCFDRLEMIDPSVNAIIETELPVLTQVNRPVVLSQKESIDGEVFEVQSNGAGLLVRSETWAPGWRATIDGREVQVLRVDCALQGVWVEAGEHRVQFRYAPKSFLAGRWISFTTALFLLSIAGTNGFKQWKKIGN